MNRRNFLNILGGGTILAAASSAGFLFSRTPITALEPWKSATTIGLCLSSSQNQHDAYDPRIGSRRIY